MTLALRDHGNGTRLIPESLVDRDETRVRIPLEGKEHPDVPRDPPSESGQTSRQDPSVRLLVLVTLERPRSNRGPLSPGQTRPELKD